MKLPKLLRADVRNLTGAGRVVVGLSAVAMIGLGIPAMILIETALPGLSPFKLHFQLAAIFIGAAVYYLGTKCAKSAGYAVWRDNRVRHDDDRD